MEERKRSFNEINNENQQLHKKITDLEAQKSALETEKSTLEEERDELSTEHTRLKEKYEERGVKIREMELSRFASAYEAQAEEYKKQQGLWFWLSIISAALLVACVLANLLEWIPSVSDRWYLNPEFYLLNAVFVTLFIYSIKQHSFLGNLKVDYSNRKVLAQSYQYIVEDEEEDKSLAEIKKGFLEKIVDIFAQEPQFHSGETLIEIVIRLMSQGKVDKK